ncbi:MAG: hypothetical protein ACK4GC_01360 [Paracoccaceae bacterium]
MQKSLPLPQTAVAAHELKTPLAELKNQAQIAAMAPNDAARRTAFARLEMGVAQTDRMVRQIAGHGDD